MIGRQGKRPAVLALTVGEDRARLRVDEQLLHVARREPAGVLADDR